MRNRCQIRGGRKRNREKTETPTVPSGLTGEARAVETARDKTAVRNWHHTAGGKKAKGIRVARIRGRKAIRLGAAPRDGTAGRGAAGAGAPHRPRAGGAGATVRARSLHRTNLSPTRNPLAAGAAGGCAANAAAIAAVMANRRFMIRRDGTIYYLPLTDSAHEHSNNPVVLFRQDKMHFEFVSATRKNGVTVLDCVESEEQVGAYRDGIADSKSLELDHDVGRCINRSRRQRMTCDESFRGRNDRRNRLVAGRPRAEQSGDAGDVSSSGVSIAPPKPLASRGKAAMCVLACSLIFSWSRWVSSAASLSFSAAASTAAATSARRRSTCAWWRE